MLGGGGGGAPKPKTLSPSSNQLLKGCWAVGSGMGGFGSDVGEGVFCVEVGLTQKTHCVYIYIEREVCIYIYIYIYTVNIYRLYIYTDYILICILKYRDYISMTAFHQRAATSLDTKDRESCSEGLNERLEVRFLITSITLPTLRHLGCSW